MNAITHPLFGQDPNPIPNNSYYDHNANIQYDVSNWYFFFIKQQYLLITH